MLIILITLPLIIMEQPPNEWVICERFSIRKWKRRRMASRSLPTPSRIVIVSSLISIMPQSSSLSSYWSQRWSWWSERSGHRTGDIGFIRRNIRTIFFLKTAKVLRDFLLFGDFLSPSHSMLFSLRLISVPHLFIYLYKYTLFQSSFHYFSILIFFRWHSQTLPNTYKHTLTQTHPLGKELHSQAYQVDKWYSSLLISFVITPTLLPIFFLWIGATPSRPEPKKILFVNETNFSSLGHSYFVVLF